jgi:hypothetical protein
MLKYEAIEECSRGECVGCVFTTNGPFIVWGSRAYVEQCLRSEPTREGAQIGEGTLRIWEHTQESMDRLFRSLSPKTAVLQQGFTDAGIEFIQELAEGAFELREQREKDDVMVS